MIYSANFIVKNQKKNEFEFTRKTPTRIALMSAKIALNKMKLHKTMNHLTDTFVLSPNFFVYASKKVDYISHEINALIRTKKRTATKIFTQKWMKHMGQKKNGDRWRMFCIYLMTVICTFQRHSKNTTTNYMINSALTKQVFSRTV